MVPFPEENILVGKQLSSFFLADVVPEAGDGFVPAIAQLLCRVPRKNFQQRQSAARVADDERFARFGVGHALEQPLPGQHERDHAGVGMEQPAGGEGKGIGPRWRQRFHFDDGVLAGQRVRPALHRNGLQIGH